MSIRTMITIRRLNMLLALAVIVLVATHWGEVNRRITFFFAGTVRAEGFTFHLNKESQGYGVLVDSGTYEPNVTAVLRQHLKRGDRFIDVGASFGWFTLIASEIVGNDGQVIAFEPDCKTYQCLRRNVESNHCSNVVLEQYALSNQRGTVRLANHHIIAKSDQSEVLDVVAMSLDEYLKDNSDSFALIKIDTEGFEGFILEGMKETLLKQKRLAILMEFYPALIRRAGCKPETMLINLADTGYEILVIAGRQKLDPISRGEIARFIELLEERDTYVNILLKRSVE